MLEDLRKRKKNAKLQLKKAVEEYIQARKDRKPVEKQARNYRSKCFKHNVELYGREKSKLIAATMTRKQKGSYVTSEKAYERTR